MKWRKPWLRLLFHVGILTLAGALLAEIFRARPWYAVSGQTAPGQVFHISGWVYLFFALVFAVLLLYTLFPALPMKEAYVTQPKGRQVCDTGFYGFCRHPGLWWFLGLMICLWGMGGISPVSAVVYFLLDLLLVLFEDRCVFRETLGGYPDYCEKVPFLIPGLRRNCAGTAGRKKPDG